MDITGERHIPASRHKVWTALHDPQLLQSCIPGCERLERLSDRDMHLVITATPGTRFNGRLRWSDTDSSGGFTLAYEGLGMSDTVRGNALITLAEDGATTLLRFAVSGVAALAPQAERFLDRFTAEVASPDEIMASGAPGMIATASDADAHAPNAALPVSLFAMIPAAPLGFPIAFWIGSALFAVIFAMVFSAYI